MHWHDNHVLSSGLAKAWCPFDSYDRYDRWKICQRSQRSNGHITVDHPNDRNDRDRWNRIRFYSSDRLSGRNDRERSYGHRLAIVSDHNDRNISQGVLQYRFISSWFWFRDKQNMILGVFWTIGTIKWTWLGDRSAIAEIDCFWTITVIVTIKWTPGLKITKLCPCLSCFSGFLGHFESWTFSKMWGQTLPQRNQTGCF